MIKYQVMYKFKGDDTIFEDFAFDSELHLNDNQILEVLKNSIIGGNDKITIEIVKVTKSLLEQKN